MVLLGSLDFTLIIYSLAFIAVIIDLFLTIGLGIYSGFNIKKRWFLPIIECIVFLLLFKVAECITYSLIFRAWFFAGVLYFMRFEIIVRCIWMTLSMLAMFVTAIMRGKKSCWIRVLTSVALIMVVTLSWGIGLNREYCPTYYKYPDYIIKEVLEYWGSIESVFGEFDISEEGYSAYGGYYTYTDEQGNDWYYTIHFLEGEVEDIRMEIH